jgi:hypothetical protein
MCYASSMVIEYMISAKSEHYTCMVHLVGSAGHLQEVENIGHGNALSTICGCLDGLAQRLQNSW